MELGVDRTCRKRIGAGGEIEIDRGEVRKAHAERAQDRVHVLHHAAGREPDRDALAAQIAVVNVLATHARVAEATVREVVAAVIEGAIELGRLNPLFVDLPDLFAPLRRQGRAALEFGGVPLHPGTLRAYREAGLLS